MVVFQLQDSSEGPGIKCTARHCILPHIIVSASVGNMVLISVNRYVAICYPLHYSSKVTEKAVTTCVFFCWICSFFYAIILSFDNLKHPGRYKSCYGECVVKISVIIDLAVNFIIPITVIIVLNMKVFVVSVYQAQAMRSHIAAVTLQGSVTVTVKKSERKAARTLGVLILVFLISYSPFYCSILARYTTVNSSSNGIAIIFVMYFNSCLNPIIYAIFYPWFKKLLESFFHFRFCSLAPERPTYCRETL